MTNEFTIEWNDLDFTKQDEIMETIKKYELEKFKEEYANRAKETPDKWDGFESFMCDPKEYALCSEFQKEEKHTYFSAALNETLEEQAQRRIDEGFKSLSIML